MHAASIAKAIVPKQAYFPIICGINEFVYTVYLYKQVKKMLKIPYFRSFRLISLNLEEKERQKRIRRMWATKRGVSLTPGIHYSNHADTGGAYSMNGVTLDMAGIAP
jgi:hypothetical protein